jgi:hypothetical protein
MPFSEVAGEQGTAARFRLQIRHKQMIAEPARR